MFDNLSVGDKIRLTTDEKLLLNSNLSSKYGGMIVEIIDVDMREARFYRRIYTFLYGENGKRIKLCYLSAIERKF